jgi:hypothetical protein
MADKLNPGKQSTWLVLKQLEAKPSAKKSKSNWCGKGHDHAVAANALGYWVRDRLRRILRQPRAKF